MPVVPGAGGRCATPVLRACDTRQPALLPLPCVPGGRPKKFCRDPDPRSRLRWTRSRAPTSTRCSNFSKQPTKHPPAFPPTNRHHTSCFSFFLLHPACDTTQPARHPSKLADSVADSTIPARTEHPPFIAIHQSIKPNQQLWPTIPTDVSRLQPCSLPAPILFYCLVPVHPPLPSSPPSVLSLARPPLPIQPRPRRPHYRRLSSIIASLAMATCCCCCCCCCRLGPLVLM